MAFKNVILYIIYTILLETNLHHKLLFHTHKTKFYFNQLITNILISYKQLQYLIIIIFKQHLYTLLIILITHIIILFKFINFIKTANPRVYLFIYFTFKFPINLYKDDTDTETFVNFVPTPMRLEIWQHFQQRNRLSHATATWRHFRFSLNPHSQLPNSEGVLAAKTRT